MDPEPRVFVVDDDPAVLRAVGRLLRAMGFIVELFSSPVAFLERLPFDGPACLVLDMRMPGLDGLQVQGQLAARSATMPTIFLSGASDVPTAAAAMREGAVDFLVKPIDDRELFQAITRALEVATEQHRQRRQQVEYRGRLARLTRRERQVCDMVAFGMLNKQIASELGTSEKTVKVHRARVMQKLQVQSVAGLVWLLSRVAEGPSGANGGYSR
jgi:FixJ family two-component response regulator